MTKVLEVYKCEVCGNIVEVLKGDGAPLVCCGQEMTKQEEKTADTSQEKHVPYIQKTATGYLVKIGQNQDHPMAPEHFIQWIELLAEGKVYRQELKAGDAPQAEFNVGDLGEVSAREYCNVHGLWVGKL